MSNSMTIRELYIKILQTIDQITEGFLKFFVSMAYKLYTKQFLELTIDQVGVIVLILIIFGWLVQKLANFVEKFGSKLFTFLDNRILPSVEKRWIVVLLNRVAMCFIVMILWIVWFLNSLDLDAVPEISN